MTLRWLNLLLQLLMWHHEVHRSACKPRWMSPQFPCDVRTSNNSKVVFDCKGRHLGKVPPGITSNATSIDLSENFIATIEENAFSNLLNLTRLNLQWANKNKNVTFGKDVFNSLSELKELQLGGTALEKVPANLPVSLTTLRLDNNKILSLNSKDLSYLKNLKQLNMCRNCYMWNPCGRFIRIEEDSFSNMTALQVLDLSFNNLTHVPKELPQSLEVLALISNRIEHFLKEDFHNLYNLKNLKINGNCPRCKNAPFPCVPCANVSLVIDPEAFQSLTRLEVLHLGGNSLLYLNPTWFETLRNLKTLLLSFNLLMKAVTEEATFLRHLPNLELIDFSFNFDYGFYPPTVNLSQEFSKLVSLKTLHMEGLVFQSIGPGTLKSLYGLRNLTTLNLGTNFIINSDSSVFSKVKPLRIICLAENRLSPIPEPNSVALDNGHNENSHVSLSPHAQKQHKTFIYEVTHHLIKQECFDVGKVLVLSSNNLFFISPKQFEGYGDIACLNLSRNGFSAALNGTEFSSLPNLKYLDLSYNKIDLAYNNAFAELKKLQVLDLSYNAHYFKTFGVTINLNFSKNLPDLKVLNMSHNSIYTLTTKELKSKSLRELQFSHNALGVLWKKNDGSYKEIFTGLTNLTILDISFNRITNIPGNLSHYLPPHLTKLYISHNKLTNFSWDELRYFNSLKMLDLSFNSLSQITGINSNLTESLTFLDLSHNQIFQLGDGSFNGLKSLETLSLSANKLTIINSSTFPEGPKSSIKTLYLHKNPFQCICDSLDFIIWIEQIHMKIPRLTTDVTCETPAKQKGQVLVYFDIEQCVNGRQAFQLYIFTTFFIVLFMFIATMSNLFYWDVSYIIHYVKAKLKGYRSLYSSSQSTFDVFVTYDTNDQHVTEWVMNNLLKKLEDEGKRRPVCLEERDWIPGVPLVDNLTQSIQYSRKTLFVLTEGYVKTGIFKLAIYLAHQRLLDENIDVIVLLMLDPVLQHSHFLRLRRRLCGKSVIEWPRTAAAEPWFWQNLRTVVREDNQLMYSKTYTNYFTSK